MNVYDLERAGRWRGGKTAVLHGPDELPPEPGSAPIPEGHVRLWHYTSADNVPSIREHGLQRKFARGDSGTGDLSEPSAGMWASTKRPDDILDDHTGNAAVVEYHAHPDEISGNAESPWQAKRKDGGYDQEQLHDWAGGYHHVIMRGDVHPRNILAIHEGWHGAARYMKHDDPSLKSYQWIHDESREPWNDHLKPYRRGLEALERERGQRHEGARQPGITTTLTGDQPYYHVTMRPGPITSLPASPHGESGPGVYLARDKAYADDMASWQPSSRALRVTVHAGEGMHLLDRTRPGGEEEYRRIQLYDNGGKNAGMDRALGAHGYHGVHYLSPGNAYPETVIHDPSRLSVSEPQQHEAARVRNFTNWDDALSELRYRKRKEPLMHRGLAVELPPEVHDFVHDQFQSRDQQARAIVRHLAGKPLGMHWAAESEQTLRHFAEWHKKNTLPGSTKVILHAALPESSEHIETDPDKLREGGVLRHDSWSSEREIPMKEGAPVNIKAVTWYGYGNRKRTGHLWGEEHTAAKAGWSYDTKHEGGFNGSLPELQYPHDRPGGDKLPGLHELKAVHSEHGEVGRLSWFDEHDHLNPSEVVEVNVDDGWQRRGIASELFRRASEITPGLRHSDAMNDNSRPWARAMPKPGRHEAVLPMPGMRNPHTGGDEWFHGTRAHPEELSEHGFTDPMEMDEGAYSQPESETEGTHWNALLGTHFTADHDVAREFALGEHSSGANQRGGDDPWRGESRNVLHARLGMHHPKVYASEHDMDHEAYEHEHAAGNHPSTHIPVGSNDEDERYEAEEMWNTADRLHRQYKNRKIPRSAQEGGHPTRTAWINTHPDKWGIANRFRDRLKAQGHDGIVYGNEYEKSKHGEQANRSAIVFHPHQIQVTQHHGAYEDHLGKEEGEHQQSRLPGAGQQELPFEHRAAAFDWDPFEENIDEYEERHRPDKPLPSETEEYWHPEHLYHGTSVDLKPGDRVEPGHASNHADTLDTRREHAYATPRIDSAREYADKAAHERGGRPRVYEVHPVHDMMPDPESNHAWGGPQVTPHPEWRSKSGFEVMHELHPHELSFEGARRMAVRDDMEYHHIQQGKNPGFNLVAASHQGKVVGHVSWGPNEAKVNNLWVHPDYRREGVASAIWHHARTIQPDLVHHPDRSDAGNAFAHSMTPDVAERKNDSSDVTADERRGQWTANQMTERIQNGHRTVRKISARRKPLRPDQHECWKCGVRAHNSEFTKGSPYAPVMGIAMECKDKAACDQRREEGRRTAAWQPTERIFGPTHGLDHRLFDEQEKLRPQVRDVLMGRLHAVLNPVLGGDWDRLVHVWLAGSQASKWTGPELEGNGDLDVLIGLATTHARLADPDLEGIPDAEVHARLNKILQHRFNISGWHPPFDPSGQEYDLTGYVIHVSDIRSINPYAAYDLTEDDWAIRPPDLPDWSPEQFPQGPALFQEARALAAQVRAVLRLPEPFRSQEAARIWDSLHAARDESFAPGGLGWQGTGNVLEKALDQASGHLVEKLKMLKYAPGNTPLALAHGMTTADLAGAHA